MFISGCGVCECVFASVRMNSQDQMRCQMVQRLDMWSCIYLLWHHASPIIHTPWAAKSTSAPVAYVQIGLWLSFDQTQRRGYLPTHLTERQKSKEKKSCKLPTNCSKNHICQSNRLACWGHTHQNIQTYMHTYSYSQTHKSISKRNFTHKLTSANAQAPSKAFEHSGRSIGFQEASNTQVEPLRLWPSYSALSPATQKEPCWALG